MPISVDERNLHNASHLKADMIKKLKEICEDYGGKFIMKDIGEAYCKIGKYAVKVSGVIITESD